MRRTTIQQITDVFERWLSLPNTDTVEVVAGAVIANRLPGDPLWLAVVGPSSTGKTEVVRALRGLKRTHFVDKVGPSTWVSGFKESAAKRKQRKNGGIAAETATYGLLTKMMDGQPHIVLVEDFSVVLGKRREVKSEVLSDLRKLYDGEYSAPFGNGVTLEWSGKMGMIVCSTGQYDQQVSDLAVFGERFTIWRSEIGDQLAVAERSGRNSEKSKEMREELRRAMQRLDSIELPEGDVPLSLDARTLVSKLSAFVACCRTPVPRDGYRREIVTVPEPEGTGRLSAQLHQLLRGLVVLHEHREVMDREADLVQKCAFSTIPSLRREVMKAMDPKRGSTTSEIRQRTGMPKVVLHRVLEEMELLRLIEQEEIRRIAKSAAWFPRDEWRPFFYHLRSFGEESYE